MSDIFSAVAVVSLVWCIAATVLIVFLAVRVSELRLYAARWKASALPLLESRIVEQGELLEALANRVKMQRVRNVVAHPGQATDKSTGLRGDDGLPDPKLDPEGWRAAMNARLSLPSSARGVSA